MGAEQSSVCHLGDEIKKAKSFISFFVNGKEYNVNVEGFGPDIGPNYVLVDFLRDKLGLTGTKISCKNAGCGACTVMIKSLHPKTGEQVPRSANSCILPLYACDGLDITTIEGIGNVKNGYHPIQERLVKFGGTQCGFCSPGLVMNMYSYAKVNPRFTGGNVEYSLDGNICRCTGYRSIMDAFKSLSKSVTDELRDKCVDIEDCYNKCPLSATAKNEESENSESEELQPEIINLPRNIHIRSRVSDKEEDWVKVTSLSTLFELLQKLSYVQTKYRLVAGNTGTGVFKNNEPYSTYVDINDVPELRETSVDKQGMVLGGGTTLTEAIDQFTAVAKTEGFVYASDFSKHFRRIASLTVRNFATLAGNLMLKHDHPEFPSDIFTLFESIGATVRIGSSPTLYRNYTLPDFLNVDMKGQLIISINLPTFGENHFFRSFKIARRYQNSYAHVNAAILFRLDKKNSFKVLSKPSICFGGISSSFVHANATEEYLYGKQLNSDSLKGALQILEREVVPSEIQTSTSPEYRRGLTLSILYKFILGMLRDTANPLVRTGADDVDRGLNTGVQTFDKDKSKYPLYQPIPKLESYPQVSGQAEFIDDIQKGVNELFGAFVLTTVANGSVTHVEASSALQSPGVVAFITAKDVPGSNNHSAFGRLQEEIFLTSKVHYCGQAIGLIVAKTRQAAFQARDKVTVKYQNIKKPTLDIKDSVHQQIVSNKKVEASLAFPCRGINDQIADEILENMKKNRQGKLVKEEDEGMFTVKGEFITRGQYHFHLENQTTLCIPREDGMDVYASTQSMDNIQAAISAALNRPSNSINVFVRRIGGGFGAKSTKANHIATACAVAASVTSKPVRIVLDLETNMRMIGKRLPYLTKYEAKVDKTGKIYMLTADVYCDAGSIPNEPSSLYFTICLQSCYKTNQWDLTPGVALTDTAPNTYCRSPASAQAICAIESIMEHIAHAVGKDPLEVRQVNFINMGDPLIGVPGAKLRTENPLPGMIDELKKSSDYESRRKHADSFNQVNRWRKRGLSIVPQRMPIYYSDFRLPTFISVYHIDGTVSVSHGGIEMGQGLNTKVAQVVAYTLKIPLDHVIVKPTNNITSPNTIYTAASVTSELICHSAQKACLNLLEKIEPVREQLDNPTWQELISVCNSKGLLLTAQHQDLLGDITSYDVWGATVIEVEVDVLTGDYRIIRADIIEDAGKSLSPLVDIGQIEGAFVMGLSWLLTENLVYDKETGELLTDNTWHYKPMLPADIPEDLRVTLLRNTPNPFGVLSSKATGEPPLNMCISVLFALRNAIDSARRDVGNLDWYPMNAPVSREDIRRMALTSSEQFTL